MWLNSTAENQGTDKPERKPKYDSKTQTEFVFKTEIFDKDLLSAIAIRCSDCFPAMSIANALGGSPSIDWKVIRTFSLVEMLMEAKKRGLELTSIKEAVGDKMVVETESYKAAAACLVCRLEDLL